MSYEDLLVQYCRDMVQHSLVKCCPSQHSSYFIEHVIVTKLEEDSLFLSEFMSEAKKKQQQLIGLSNSTLHDVNGAIGLDVKSGKTNDCALLANIRNNLFNCLLLAANSHCHVGIEMRKAALLSDIEFISETLKSCQSLDDKLAEQLYIEKESNDQAKLLDQTTKKQEKFVCG